jgi:hypothetical protein
MRHLYTKRIIFTKTGSGQTQGKKNQKELRRKRCVFSAGYQQDEDFHMNDFFVAETFAGKGAAAFSFPAREPPGQRHIYHTTDTFILTSAMQRFLQAATARGGGEGAPGGHNATARAGTAAAATAAAAAAANSEEEELDIWELLVSDVLAPLELSMASLSTLRTYDAEQQPYGGYGLWFKRDDLAKVGIGKENACFPMLHFDVKHDRFTKQARDKHSEGKVEKQDDAFFAGRGLGEERRWAGARQRPAGARARGLVSPTLYSYCYSRSFYQDRLGTKTSNTGKALKTGRPPLSILRCSTLRRSTPRCSWTLPPAGW